MKKHLSKEEKNKYNKEIPVEIRVLFGKFIVFSLVFSIFFILYPLVIVRYLSVVSKYILLFGLPLLYVVMIIDVYKHKKTFFSYVLPLGMFISLMSYIFCLIYLFR